MANARISDLTADTNPAAADLVATVDVSDTTDAASGTTKKATLTNLNKGLPAFTGDSGSGGVKGLVPAPAAGDAAAGKFLKADGTFAAPAGGSGGLGDVVGPGSSTDNAVARYDSTTGKIIQNSNLTLPDDAASTEVGYMNIPQNSQSADYTAAIADRGKHVYHPVGDNNPRTFTIPANASVAFAIGTAITFVNDKNTLTIAITSDTLVWAEDGSTGSRTLAENGICTALKVTSTRWIISGVGLS